MYKNNKIQRILLILLFLLLTACSNDESVAEEVADEDLIAVVESNVENLMAKDLDGYMATIHSESPVYDVTSKTIIELFDYTLDIKLTELTVGEKSLDEATVFYTQRTIAADDPTFRDNETSGKHVLRPENDEWKIYHSEQINVSFLEPEVPQAEAVEMEGIYVEQFSKMEANLDDDWVLIVYKEGDGEATAEYIQQDENLGNYKEIITIDYYEDGNELSGLANFISIFQESLNEVTTGDFEFIRLLETEAEVFYQFTITGDLDQIDQSEVGRIFIRDNDFYLVRYTAMEQELEDVESLMEFLREIE